MVTYSHLRTPARLLALASVVALSAVGSAQTYSLVHLGPTDQYSDSVAVNNSGKTVGRNGSPDGVKAATWDVNGNVTFLDPGTTPYGNIVSGLNNHGVSVGVSYGSTYDAVQWAADGTMSILAGNGGLLTAAKNINDAGTVVGYGYNSTNSDINAVIWHGGVISTLASGAYDYELAQDINNNGIALGYSASFSANQGRAMTWDADGNATTLFAPDDASLTVGYAINDSGMVAGGYTTWADVTSACVWDGSEFTNLGTLSGDNFSSAQAMNNSGAVVGMSSIDGNDSRAFLWTEAGGMIDLNTLVDAEGWVLSNATGISDTGYITGQGYYYGEQRSFLLKTEDAVPEPASMVALGLGGLALLRRRRAK